MRLHLTCIKEKADMDRTGINEIASLLSAKNEKITKEEATLFLKEWIAVISDTLAEKKAVEVTGFGTFSFSPIRERETATQIEAGSEEVPYFYKIGFTPHASLKNSVNIFFSNFEPSLLSEGVTFDAIPEVIAGEEGEEEYIYNHLQKMVSFPKPPVPAATKEEPAITAEETTAEETTAEETTAEEIAAEEITSEEIAAEEIAAEEITTEEITAEEITAEEIATEEITAEEIKAEEITTEEITAEISENMIEPEASTEPEQAVEPLPPLSNILSESLQHLSPEPQVSHATTHRERGRRRRRQHSVWVPVLGGMAIIVAALFFFRDTPGKSGSNPL